MSVGVLGTGTARTPRAGLVIVLGLTEQISYHHRDGGEEVMKRSLTSLGHQVVAVQEPMKGNQRKKMVSEGR